MPETPEESAEEEDRVRWPRTAMGRREWRPWSLVWYCGNALPNVEESQTATTLPLSNFIQQSLVLVLVERQNKFSLSTFSTPQYLGEISHYTDGGHAAQTMTPMMVINIQKKVKHGNSLSHLSAST